MQLPFSVFLTPFYLSLPKLRHSLCFSFFHTGKFSKMQNSPLYEKYTTFEARGQSVPARPVFRYYTVWCHKNLFQAV